MKMIILLLLHTIIIAIFTGCLFISDGKESPESPEGSAVIISMQLLYQHKDTSSIPCNAMPPQFPPCPIFGAHGEYCVPGPTGSYGDNDDCVHCSAYCAPASIAMVSSAYGKIGNLIKQDYIYDNGKSTSPEVKGNGSHETHGVGMFDGSGGKLKEVQTALDYALDGITHHQHDSADPIDWIILKDYINMNCLVLWLDHGGWPANQSELWPPAENQQDQGHAKVIAGYDDKDTVDPADDLCLIYDPWPYYNHKQGLPANALKGPGDTFDPYWLPQSDVLNDPNDIFLVPTDPIQ
jgi:hypothetical protein